MTETDPERRSGGGAERFRFRFDPVFRPLLAGLGVTPATAWVDVDTEQVRARFGPWVCVSSVRNIVDVQVSGPYLAAKAIGARLSRTDRGLTFGTTTAGGVCLLFDEPVPGLEPLGAVRHPGLTVTVSAPAAFEAAVRAAAGLTSR